MHNIAFSHSIPETIMAPLGPIVAKSTCGRKCPSIADEHWIQTGVKRVLSDAESGRGFLQQFGHLLPACPSHSNFFAELKSSRRLKYVAEVAKQLADSMPDKHAVPDVFKKYALYSADGHWHEAAVHDEKIDDRRWAVGHVYAQNLRSGAIHHLAIAEGRKEHDMSIIKRLGAEQFRMGEEKGQRVAMIWDRASINFTLWYEWKRSHGIYFVSRAKENMVFEPVGINEYDLTDPINVGVESDELVATSQGVVVRKINYTNPVDGKQFVFLTTINDLPPGAIAWLYLQRWGIEKSFDVFKNKLGETKAWASGENAKCMQAEFLCLAVNLLTLLGHNLQENHGIEDVAGRKRQEQRMQAQKDQAARNGKGLGRLITETVRPLVLSVKLIRWVRAYWASSAPLTQLLGLLQASYATL